MKICRKCGEEKPTTEYRQANNILISGQRSKHLRSYCVTCEKKRARDHMFKLLRGISHEERDALLKSQGGACAVCETKTPGSKKGWHVDHCHTSQRIRGILCATCNIALGMVNDSVDRLSLLTQYLLRHQQQGATTRA